MRAVPSTERFLTRDAADQLFEGPGEMAALLRAKDWARTPLGPVDTWPASLRTTLRIMLGSRYSMWVGWGPDLTFFYNDGYVPTLGAKHPHALGRPTREVWSEIWPEIGPRIEAVVARGEATWDEALMLFLQRNGYTEETYHTFSYSPVPGDDGRVAGVFCVVLEETARVVGERRLKALRALASRLSSTSSVADVCAATERTLEESSHAIPFALAYLFDEERGQASRIVRAGIDADHPAAARAFAMAASPWALDEVRRTGAPVEVPLPADRTWPKGPWPEAPTRALVLPIAGQGQSRPAGALVAALNPHRPFDAPYREFLQLFVGQLAAGLANASAYEAERRRAESLAEIDRAKTAFFTNVSHEFRTPLTLMMGPATDALEDPALPPGPERERWALVQRNATRLLRLVNSLLEFSRMEAGRVRAAYRPTDLAQFTAELASSFRSAVERAGIAFEVECPPLSRHVHVDHEMWEKVVLNLVSNAFKFTFSGRISVRVLERGGHAILEVRDTGVGVPASELPRLFERFHRVEGTKSRSHEGSGIGLALVQELVKLHGGTISAESLEGAGTTFRVEIPLGTAHLPAEHVVREASPAKASAVATSFVEEARRWLPEELTPAPVAAAPEAGRQRRVLLADDNADMRAYVQRLLAGKYEVTAVADGRQAVLEAKRSPPDLVLTDVMMPELDGFGVLRELRGDEATRAVPVVMLSARAGEESRVEGLSAGADDYLVKPFSARELLARVETHIELSRLRAAAEHERRRFQDLFVNAPAVIAILRGPDHVFDFANPAYRELVGNREVLGKPLREALPEIVPQGFIELLDGVYRTGVPYAAREARVQIDHHGDGVLEDRWINFVYHPSRTSDGGIDGVFVFGFDVTDQVAARQTVEIAHAAAVEAVRVREDFLSVASHELRTPVTSISLNNDMLERQLGREAPELRSRLGPRVTAMRGQSRRLVSLVDRLMDVARLSTGRLELAPEPVDFGAVVKDVCESFGEESTRTGSQLQVRRHGDLGGTWDPVRLQQIVSNLVSNALKYGEGQPVAVTVDGQGSDVVLEVVDYGNGIAPQDQARIFERFERASSVRHIGGFGVGLWVVRQLVEAMGGKVAVESAVGQGARFVVRLPRGPAQG